MKKLLFMGWLLLSSNLFAQKAIEIKVWPNGAPNTNEMTQQVKDGPLYVEEPILTVYPAKNGNGMAIVACPGGAYWTLAMGHDAREEPTGPWPWDTKDMTWPTGLTVRASHTPYSATACPTDIKKFP